MQIGRRIRIAVLLMLGVVVSSVTGVDGFPWWWHHIPVQLNADMNMASNCIFSNRFLDKVTSAAFISGIMVVWSIRRIFCGI